MNSMPMDSEIWSHRDSWPPTQVHLRPSLSKGIEPRPLLEIGDEDDPLTYFLTPTTMYEDDEDECMTFDAGIEGCSHNDNNKEVVRSVSPSTLYRLNQLNHDRPLSPFSDTTMTSADEDDNEEEYIRFGPGSPSRLESIRDSIDLRPRNPTFDHSTNRLLSPSSPKLRSWRARPRSPPMRRRPSHLWREPSPEIGSIEEETEEDMGRDVGGSAMKTVGILKVGGKDKGKGRATNHRKTVRFVLPGRED